MFSFDIECKGCRTAFAFRRGMSPNRTYCTVSCRTKSQRVRARRRNRLRSQEVRDLKAEVKRLQVELAARVKHLEHEVRLWKQVAHKAKDAGPLPWDELAELTGDELRQFVLIGRRMAKIEHDSPVKNAMRWVTGNRIFAAPAQQNRAMD